jgi:very-short-patch-repair endonuclease
MHHLPLPEDEVTTEKGIPVTTVARTLLDLAAVLPARKVARAVNEAEIREQRDLASLAALVERHRHRYGIRAMRGILDDLQAGASLTRSELEARFREFVSERSLAPPEFNARVFAGGLWFECDCLWRAQRFVVELDGHAVHQTRAAFERDRERDRMLSVAGWRVVRITWRQLRDEPERVAADLRKLLAG